MKDSDLQFDRSVHVLYSKPCKKQILSHIAQHYPPPEQEAVWTRVQQKYIEFITGWRTDLGGKKNFHNGPGGNYDCVALMAYYVVCKEKTSLAEIERMEAALFLPAFRTLSRFVNVKNPLVKRLLYKSFQNAKRQCDKWGDFVMRLAPFDKEKPIYYEFTACPTADFARSHGLLSVMPALCNPDFEAMELLGARLVRTTTCANGCKCDYTICAAADPYCTQHPEYRDAAGYRRNKP